MNGIYSENHSGRAVPAFTISDVFVKVSISTPSGTLGNYMFLPKGNWFSAWAYNDIYHQRPALDYKNQSS